MIQAITLWICGLIGIPASGIDLNVDHAYVRASIQVNVLVEWATKKLEGDDTTGALDTTREILSNHLTDAEARILAARAVVDLAGARLAIRSLLQDQNRQDVIPPVRDLLITQQE